MDNQFIRHVNDRMASRFGVTPSKRAGCDGMLYVAELPGAGVCVTLTPLSGRDELILGLVWPPADSTLGYADLYRFLPTGRREAGFWIDVRMLGSVDRRFPSDARFDTHAFLPRPVDFADMVAAMAGSRLVSPHATPSAPTGTMTEAGRSDVDKTLGHVPPGTKAVGQMDSSDRFFVHETEG